MEYGFSLAETAHRFGVSTSAAARVLERNEKKVQFVNNIPFFSSVFCMSGKTP